ncbi:MAG: type II 3-dehydroquinate dehydratase [Elusimicrobiota bacterium]|nr:type II 3-dehydroquinate dehydratase [Elusimicrobiota bacterium]
MNILIIHGPNLNLLGEREPEIYGNSTLKELNSYMRKHAKTKEIKLKIFQTNYEGKILDLIASHRKWADWLIINPAALTYYSYAIRDAIKGIDIKAVEVHLSDIKKRESFRKKSVILPACKKQISGFGKDSYIKAIDFCLKSK